MTITTASDMLDVQVLEDQVRGVFAGRNALMGSVLVSGGAVLVNGSMPKGGSAAIGKTITVPYFGTIGEFTNNADGSSVTPSKLTGINEDATISRDSLAAEISVWAQGVAAVDPALGDPYEEATTQIQEAAVRAMDSAIVTVAKATPLIEDVYSSTSPVYIDYDKVIGATAKWGDEGDDIVAMAVHSRTLHDMALLKDAVGRPLLVSNQAEGQGMVRKFAGYPLIVSDRVPLDGSTMGTVASTGTSPPTATIAGTPTGPWNLVIDAITGTATTIVFRFSTDGGNTWSVSTLTAEDDSVAVDLIDTANDSLVGNNGATGLTVAFAAGTFNADNQWTSTANLKTSSLLFSRGSCAFWYNSALMRLLTDKDILADTDVAAMHLYRAAHLYRRRRGGTKPGVVALKHNCRNYIG